MKIYNKVFIIKRQMNSKLDAIRNLKTKLLEMQRGLEKMASKEQQPFVDKALFTKTLNFEPNTFQRQEILNYHTFRSPEKERRKNPTFWGQNPIVNKQNVSSPGKWQKKSPIRHRKVNLSPNLASIMNSIDKQYYHDVQEKSFQQEKLYQTNPVKIPKRYEYSFHGLQRDTPRFQRIKTFEHQETNPILNPNPVHYAGKKIVKKPVVSPKNALTENPASDPHIYFFRNKQTSLSPSTKIDNRKNFSTNMKEVLNRSLQEKSVSPPRKHSRKHFQRYFKDTFESSWH